MMNEWIQIILVCAVNGIVTYFVNRFLIQNVEKLGKVVKNGGRSGKQNGSCQN